jgi:hypothetical protein
VHGFWCAREGALSEAQWNLLAALGLPPEATEALETDAPSPVNIFSYDFAENVQEGIREFLRYAYYHGILPDVPDLRFFGAQEAEGEEEPPLPGLN